jgi:hypothetical protein
MSSTSKTWQKASRRARLAKRIEPLSADSILVHPTEKPGLDLQVLGKLSALLGDVGLQPTARLRVGVFLVPAEGFEPPTFGLQNRA